MDGQLLFLKKAVLIADTLRHIEQNETRLILAENQYTKIVTFNNGDTLSKASAVHVNMQYGLFDQPSYAKLVIQTKHGNDQKWIEYDLDWYARYKKGEMVQVELEFERLQAKPEELNILIFNGASKELFIERTLVLLSR